MRYDNRPLTERRSAAKHIAAMLNQTFDPRGELLTDPPTMVGQALLTPDTCADLLSWTDLNVHLTNPIAPPAEIVLSRDGEVVPPQEFLGTPRHGRRVDAVALGGALRNDQTLIINRFETVDAAIATLTGALTTHLGEPTSCNLFASFGATGAFTPHCDEVDVIIVQLSGTKRWRVHGPGTVANPLPEHSTNDPADCPDQTMLDTRLEVGDVLHVPRGWWHTVTGTAEHSVHLSLTISRSTGYDVLKWLVDEAITDPCIRQTVNLNATTDGNKSESDSKSASIEAVLAAFLAAAQQRTLSEFATARNAQVALPAEPLCLPWSANLDHGSPVTVELIAPFGIELDADADHVTVTTSDTRVSMPIEYRPVMETLAASDAITTEQLAQKTGVDANAIRSLANVLLRHGLVRFTVDTAASSITGATL